MIVDLEDQEVVCYNVSNSEINECHYCFLRMMMMQNVLNDDAMHRLRYVNMKLLLLGQTDGGQ